MDRHLAFGLAVLALLTPACQGKDGQDGLSWLVRLEAEAPGDHCPLGGTRVLAGPDANRDAVLQDAEVAETSFVCGAAPSGCTTLPGSYTIRNGWDLGNLVAAGCTSLTGDLVVDAPGLAAEVRIPALTEVRNLRVIGNDLLTGLSLPALATVRGELRVEGNPALAALSLPALATVEGPLGVVGCPALAALDLPALAAAGGLSVVAAGVTSVSLPRLAAAGGGVSLQADPALAAVDLPVLASGLVEVLGCQGLAALQLPALEAGGLNLQEVPALAKLAAPRLATSNPTVVVGTALTSLDLPALVEGASLQVHRSPHLAALALPRLARLTDLVVLELPALQALSLPALAEVSGSFTVMQDATLSTIDLPALPTVGQYVNVIDNPALPECLVTALVARWTAAGGATLGVAVSGNDASATCP
jgi:hypothetical protein